MGLTEEFWPGTDIKKSTWNCFSVNHDGPHVEWAKEFASAKSSVKCTADVERRRKNGNDYSTIAGMGRRSDIATRKPPARPRNLGITDIILGALKSGAMSGADLAKIAGVHPKRVRDLLKYHKDLGRVEINKESRPAMYSLAVK